MKLKKSNGMYQKTVHFNLLLLPIIQPSYKHWVMTVHVTFEPVSQSQRRWHQKMNLKRLSKFAFQDTFSNITLESMKLVQMLVLTMSLTSQFVIIVKDWRSPGQVLTSLNQSLNVLNKHRGKIVLGRRTLLGG